MRADDIMEEGREAITDRAKTRDQPTGERSMARCVAIFNAWTNHKLSEADGWRLMISLKQAREIQGEPHRDDYVDMSSYPALLGECVLHESA